MTIRRIRTDIDTVKNGSYTVNYNGKNTISKNSSRDIEKKIDAFLEQYESWNRRFDDTRYYSGSSSNFNSDPTYIDEPIYTPGYNNLIQLNTPKEEGCYYTAIIKKVDPLIDASTAFYNLSSLPGNPIIALVSSKFLNANSTIVDITAAGGAFGDLWIDQFSYCVGIDWQEDLDRYTEYTCALGPQNGQYGWGYELNNIVGGPFLSGVCDDETNTNCGVTIENGEQVINHPHGYCAGFDRPEDGVYVVTALNRDSYPLGGTNMPLLPITYPTNSIEPFLILVHDGIIKYKIPFLSRDYGDINCSYWDSLLQTCRISTYRLKVAHQLLVGFATSRSWMAGATDVVRTANIMFVEDQAIQAATGFTARDLAVNLGACDDYCFYPFSSITYETSLGGPTALLCNPSCWPIGRGTSLQSCESSVNYSRFNNINPDTQCYTDSVIGY